MAANTNYANTLQAIDGQLDIEAQTMLSNGTMESLDASHVYLTIGTASGTSANIGHVVGHHHLPNCGRATGDEPLEPRHGRGQ